MKKKQLTTSAGIPERVVRGFALKSTVQTQA